MSHIDGMKLLMRRVALHEQETDRVRSESQLEAGRQAVPSKTACHSAQSLRPKRRFGGSMRLLLLLLLLSCTALAQAKKTGPKPVKPRVIKESSRIVPKTQMPDHWITWTNRGSDCVLMTSVCKLLVLPEVPKMLNKCRGPLCKMLRSIARKPRVLSKRFTKCNELAQLLGYEDKDAAGANGYHGIPTMARLLLTLADESKAIKERFQADSDVTRFCDDKKAEIHLSLPFIIVQQLNYDFISDGDNLFVQAARRSEDQTLRDQYLPLAYWLSEIFADERLGKAAGLKPKHRDFFTCEQGQNLTLSFRFRRMSRNATHAIFLLQPPTLPWLSSHGQLTMDPDAAGYSGHVSLETNRAVWFQDPVTSGTQKDHRLWELYSCSLKTLIWPQTSDLTDVESDKSDVNNVEPIRHAYPLWYPYGAQEPPRFGAICDTFERKSPEEFEIYTAEWCNRNAPAQSMAFVATRRKGTSESKKDGSDESLFDAVVRIIKSNG